MFESRLWSKKWKVAVQNKWLMCLLVLLLVSLNIWVFSKISFLFYPILILFETILLSMLLTVVFFYLLNPIVDFLEKYRFKRAYSILVLYLLIAAIITLVVVAVLPLLKLQIVNLMQQFPNYSREVQNGFEAILGSKYLNPLQESFGFDSASLMESVSLYTSNLLNNTVASLGGFVSVITETVLSIVVVPFILFYLLKDRQKFVTFILGLMPLRLRRRSFGIMVEMNHQISSYIRGQIIVSGCIGLLLYIGYLIIGLDYALALALIAACTNIVPYLGPAIAMTPALVVATVTSPMMLLNMVVIWTIVQLIEAKFISPQIMGKAMQIHPITIIFVILTAGKMFGILGIILAVPGYAMVKVIAVHLFRWFKSRSGLYEDTSPIT
ncbi:putative integral inner membrane protein [Niallia circulans]|uniref:AI-2E family transporter n=1 Tax=Shouchella clausii TaxID=79880 RepID=UPI000BA66034|nr:AI-2E family transporter [Shouchella clausii]MCM3548959.1 AI-2E family transporter [Shouchella clausii]PAF14323.1 AI-2E family transporter [Shouchella clausii]SPU21408.1 putative integral inner membrane protein [Niallia circulans]